MRNFQTLRRLCTRQRLAAGGIFLLGLALTALLAGLFSMQNRMYAQKAFNEKARDVVQNIQDRALRLESRLRTMAAMHKAQLQHNPMSASVFSSYVEVLYSLHQFKAVRSFSFVERIPSEQLTAFEAARRKETDDQFEVTTYGNPDAHYIVKYIQPLTPNKSLLGLDWATNPVALHNLEESISSNSLQLSSNINLPSHSEEEATYMFSLPVFKRQELGATQDGASPQLIGVFNAVFTAADVLKNITELNQGTLNFELWEDNNPNGRQLAYSYTTGDHPVGDHTNTEYTSQYFAEHPFTIAGRAFTLRSSSTAIFDQLYNTRIPELIGLIGSILSALAAWWIYRHLGKRSTQQSNDPLANTLQAMIKKLPGLVAYWNADLRCEFANEGYLHYFGKNHEEMHHIHIKDLLTEALYNLNESFILGALAGNNQSFERRITKPSGEVAYTLTQYLVVKDQNQVVGFVAYITDITQFKTAEKKALFSEVALNTISQGIVVTDQHNRVQYVNPAFSTITGYQAEEILDKSTRILQGVQTDIHAIRALNTHITEGKPITQVLLNYRKDGQTFWNEMSISPVQQPNGEIINFVGVINDITPRIKNEQERAQALAAAQTANQSKTLFLANTSHEMRTPLHGMLGMLQLLQKTPLSAQQGEYAEAISSAAKSLLEQINQLLDLSKLEARKIKLEPHSMELDTLRNETMQWLPILTNNKPVHIRFDIDPQIAHEPLIADAARLRQIIINLSNNAIRFTQRGEVTISIDLLQRTNKDCTLEFSVRDTGIGISEADMARIFNNFEQVDGSTTRYHGGTGLGLPISKQLVELMGGTLEVKSQLNVGSQFFFQLTLPYAQTHTSSTATSSPTTATSNKSIPAALPPLPLRNINILIAEDNPLNQKVVRMLLEPEGAIVTVVENGKQAVQAVRDGNPQFDVVLMDLQMPEMDGYCATQIIREQLGKKNLPIIAVTASAMLNDRAESLKAGMNDYVSKPFNTDQLVTAIIKQLR